MRNWECKALKDYKGYGIDKCWWVDLEGRKVGEYFYLVSEGEDYIGSEYSSLTEAKKYIDEIA